MDYIKLLDGTQIDIQDGGTISALVNISDSEPTARVVVDALTNENVKHIEFFTPGSEEPYGVYDDMVLNAPVVRINTEAGIEVHFGFRGLSDVEKRLNALETSQTDVEVALAEVYEMIVK